MDEWVGGWMDGWMGGWTDGVAGEHLMSPVSHVAAVLYTLRSQYSRVFLVLSGVLLG